MPWVVQVDKLGQAQAVAPAVADYRPTDPQIAFHLARFIEQVRSHSGRCRSSLRQNWLRAYDFTTDRGAAGAERLRPRQRSLRQGRQAAGRGRGLERHPRLADSFRVAWTERHYDNGQLAATERWTAILTIVVQPPRDAERLRKNPLGIYVNAINWSKELG